MSTSGSLTGGSGVPTWLRWLGRKQPGLLSRYFVLDARSLGLARIYLGSLLLIDLLRRIPYLSAFYTNAGLLPNHMLLWRPGAELQFSLFFLASHTHEAVALFVLCGIVFATFLAGYQTRLLHFLSFVCICSLHNRLILLDDGSETTTRLLTFWTMFLPMGRRFSLDALRTRIQPADQRVPQKEPEVVSLAVLAILLQVAAIYFFNALHKDGRTWRAGSAVHYVLHQDRIVTWLGWQLRPYLTLGWSRTLSWASLAIEALLPLLILCPWATKATRRIAIGLAVALHLGFAALLNLGMFSFNMIGFFLLLLSDRDWDLLACVGQRFPLRARSVLHHLASATSLALGPTLPSREWLSARAADLREILVAIFVLALGSQLLMSNRGVPDWLRVHNQPRLFRALVEYPRLHQGWSMFAPDAPKTDFELYVDARTVDGRHVDPLNEAASRTARVPLKAIPEFLDQDDAWCDYSVNIVGTPAYQSALSDWILAYPQRTGRSRDRIKKFDVWEAEDESPAPGEAHARHFRKKRLMHVVAPP